jgi:single-strand DNA-binding protein
MYHDVTIAGRLGKDPEARYTPDAKFVCNFSVAVDTGKDQTMWVRVTAWERTGEIANEYLSKGSPVLVQGRLNHDEFGNPNIWFTGDDEPRASFEVTANVIRFLGRAEPQAQAKEDEGIVF